MHGDRGDWLANARRVRVDRAKIVGCLLSTDDSDGRSKAAFFQGPGFDGERWLDLAAALREHGHVGTVIHMCQDRAALKVEFLALDGHGAAVATVLPSQVGDTAAHFGCGTTQNVQLVVAHKKRRPRCDDANGSTRTS